MAPPLLYRDALFYMHEPPDHHVEGPWRLETAYRALLEAGALPGFEERPAPPRQRAERELLLVHDESYVRLVEKLSRRGGGYLDADTYVNEYTYEAGLAVAASVLDAVREAVEAGRSSLVLARPPGHHAGRYGAAMGAPTLGFCIFNATALAAIRAADLGLRVLVLDFDLHHGNGTQEILYTEPRVVHLDLHQDPSTIYPGTGWPWQSGEGEAEGTKLNAVLPPYSGDDVFTYMLDEALELALRALGGTPDIVLVDAGFDGYRGDGLGLLDLTTHAYQAVAERLRRLHAPVVTVLEGGYSEGLRRGLPAYIAALHGLGAPRLDEEPTESPRSVWREAEENLRRLKNAARPRATP